MVLFVLLGFRLHPLGFDSLLLWLLLLRHWGELGLADLVSSGLAELLGLLVEFVQVELSDDVLLMETSMQSLKYKDSKCQVYGSGGEQLTL